MKGLREALALRASDLAERREDSGPGSEGNEWGGTKRTGEGKTLHFCNSGDCTKGWMRLVESIQQRGFRRRILEDVW